MPLWARPRHVTAVTFFSFFFSADTKSLLRDVDRLCARRWFTGLPVRGTGRSAGPNSVWFDRYLDGEQVRTERKRTQTTKNNGLLLTRCAGPRSATGIDGPGERAAAVGPAPSRAGPARATPHSHPLRWPHDTDRTVRLRLSV